MGSGPAQCDAPGCGADIIFIPVHKQAGGLANMPLNATPDPTGNVIVGPSGQSRTGRIKRKGEEPGPHEQVYLPHFATCTRPKDYRRRETPATPPAEPQPAALFEETP